MSVRRLLMLLLLVILYRKANRFGVGTHVSRGIIWVTVNFEQTTPGWG
jgi:hypothetical protein